MPSSATFSDIKKAYHQLALRFHPDKLHSSVLASEEAFKKLQTAYEVLSDAEKRRRYDAELYPCSWFAYLGTLFTACLDKHQPHSKEDSPQPAASP